MVPGEVLDDGFHEWRLSATLAIARIRKGGGETGGTRFPRLGLSCGFRMLPRATGSRGVCSLAKPPREVAIELPLGAPAMTPFNQAMAAWNRDPQTSA